MENKKIICVDCNQEFELTAGWHKLIEENPDIQPPKRCYNCRQKRKTGKEPRSFGADRDFGKDKGFKSRW